MTAFEIAAIAGAKVTTVLSYLEHIHQSLRKPEEQLSTKPASCYCCGTSIPTVRRKNLRKCPHFWSEYLEPERYPLG